MTETGIIMKGIGGFYYVKTAGGLIECRARGRFRKDGETPMVGDRVIVTLTEEDPSRGSVSEILPRKNVFIRPPVANIDQLIVTISAKNPEPNLLLADRLTVTAEAAGVAPVICINKTDLDEITAADIAEIYKTTGYPVFLTSRENNLGNQELQAILKDKITALAGNSGVGKSSIINRITGNLSLATGSVSAKTQRGRHTTRHTELFHLSFGGYVFDTPGFSSYGTEGITYGNLQYLFPEIARHAGHCRFAGCNHLAEPSCSVKEALDEGKISASRYQSYQIIFQELKAIPTYK